jgi:pimeloyl-ACP methyl ester carboxylesterase
MKEQLERYLQEFLVRLNVKRRLPLYVDGMSVGTDFRYVAVDVDPSLKKPIPILLLTGWGSGWEGILPLAFSLTCRGYRVILVSLPGYGNSKNPPPRYWRENLYRHHADIVLTVLDKFATRKAYFVGHSMGAEVLAEAARICPKMCEKLVLLHPSGIKKVGFFGKFVLLCEFAASGARLRREYRDSPESSHDPLKALIDLCGTQKSPWRGRLKLRWAEFQEICRGGLLETLKEVSAPIIFLSGGRDTVYPAWESFHLIYQAIPEKKIAWNILPENHHNPTLFHSDTTAETIDDLLKEQREED